MHLSAFGYAGSAGHLPCALEVVSSRLGGMEDDARARRRWEGGSEGKNSDLSIS